MRVNLRGGDDFAASPCISTRKDDVLLDKTIKGHTGLYRAIQGHPDRLYNPLPRCANLLPLGLYYLYFDVQEHFLFDLDHFLLMFPPHQE